MYYVANYFDSSIFAKHIDYVECAVIAYSSVYNECTKISNFWKRLKRKALENVALDPDVSEISNEIISRK